MVTSGWSQDESTKCGVAHGRQNVVPHHSGPVRYARTFFIAKACGLQKG